MNLEPVTGEALKTRLTVRHDFPAEVAAPRPRALVDDHWRLAMGNLTAYLADGVGLVRPDFSDPAPEVRASIDIAAPPAAVFRALTEPEGLNQWIAAAATVDLRVGGSMSFGWSYEVDGRTVAPVSRILEIVPNERLVMDWPDWRGDPSVPRQTIRWDLQAIPSGTRVTLTHTGFVRAVDIGDYGFGWAEFLSRLRTCVEQTR